MNASGEGGGKITHLRPPGPQDLPPHNTESETRPQDAISDKLENIGTQVCDVMWVVSLIAASAPDDVLIGDADYKRAARAISLQLDAILSQIYALAEDLDRGQPVNTAPAHPG